MWRLFSYQQHAAKHHVSTVITRISTACFVSMWSFWGGKEVILRGENNHLKGRKWPLGRQTLSRTAFAEREERGRFCKKQAGFCRKRQSLRLFFVILQAEVADYLQHRPPPLLYYKQAMIIIHLIIGEFVWMPCLDADFVLKWGNIALYDCFQGYKMRQGADSDITGIMIPAIVFSPL